MYFLVNIKKCKINKMLYKHAFNGNGALEHTTAQMKP